MTVSTSTSTQSSSAKGYGFYCQWYAVAAWIVVSFFVTAILLAARVVFDSRAIPQLLA
jgi:hypothetical protein